MENNKLKQKIKTITGRGIQIKDKMDNNLYSLMADVSDKYANWCEDDNQYFNLSNNDRFTYFSEHIYKPE